MLSGNSSQFYNRLPVNQLSLGELLSEPHLFYHLPEDWQVIITDVKGSTNAVKNGQHETVNLVATGSMVAVLNKAYQENISVPFFFGGDGATFIIPPEIFEPAFKSLLLHRENTRSNFNLEIRVGNVPVGDIYANGHNLMVTKLKTSELFSIPVALGTGLHYAEKLVKGNDYFPAALNTEDGNLDMSGMECSWDRIKPPLKYDEVVSLIVLAQPEANQANAYRKVAELIDSSYGEPEKRKPITEAQLKLKRTFNKINQEMKGKFKGFNLPYLAATWLKLALGPLYFKTKTGKKYLNQLVQLADTLVIDGKINTVISGNTGQRMELEKGLHQLELAGEIWYGLHVSSDSVLSCYVRNRNEKHVHFVDGSDGGYTRAAMMLKNKIQNANN
jgi:hypothetical protein